MFARFTGFVSRYATGHALSAGSSQPLRGRRDFSITEAGKWQLYRS